MADKDDKNDDGVTLDAILDTAFVLLPELASDEDDVRADAEERRNQIKAALAGFDTIGQPAAMAGPILWAKRFRGKLNGEIAATGPIGSYETYPRLFDPFGCESKLIVLPQRVLAIDAENFKV